MKRIVLAYLDLRAQLRLWLAEISHDSALKIVHDAREEMDRSVDFARATQVGLKRAQDDATDAARNVRRHNERTAMGLR